MLIEEVDHVRVEPLQSRFRNLANMLRSAVQSMTDHSFFEAELRGDHNLVPD
jgi:hypothetical protein